jgi:hypothetical protein
MSVLASEKRTLETSGRKATSRIQKTRKPRAALREAASHSCSSLPQFLFLRLKVVRDMQPLLLFSPLQTGSKEPSIFPMDQARAPTAMATTMDTATSTAIAERGQQRAAALNCQR